MTVQDGIDLIAANIESQRPTLREYLRSRSATEARSSVEWKAGEMNSLESLKTRTTRYQGEDGQERAVILWPDYETLVRVFGQQSAYRAGSSNAYLDIERRIENGEFAEDLK